jgi:hypothetical protein
MNRHSSQVRGRRASGIQSGIYSSPFGKNASTRFREIGLRDRSVRPRVMLSEFAVYAAGAFRDKTKG